MIKILFNLIFGTITLGLLINIVSNFISNFSNRNKGLTLFFLILNILILVFFNYYYPEKENITPISQATIQLKGQLLYKSKPLVNFYIKILEYSDSDSKTQSEGKFEFKGIPYDETNRVIHLQVKCDQIYKEVQRIDLTNKDKFHIRGGWIDLGSIDLEEKPCENKIIPTKPTRKNEPKSDGDNKEYAIIQLVLNSKNYDDEIYINEEKPVFEEGTSQIIKFIKLEIGKSYRIKVGDCKIQEIKVTQSSIRKIYPC